MPIVRRPAAGAERGWFMDEMWGGVCYTPPHPIVTPPPSRKSFDIGWPAAAPSQPQASDPHHSLVEESRRFLSIFSAFA
jgi:hypothetical protein